MIRYIDLFAGVGGFHYGIDMAIRSYLRNGSKDVSGGVTNSQEQSIRATCVYSNEWDKYANSIYRRHYNECDNRDIRTVKSSEIPDFDLLCGGFPCQTFSVAGKRLGFDDTRGTLFYEIARIVADKRPPYLLLENVKGLLSHDEGRTFQTILGVLSDLGYDVQWQVLNSKDFGVPQNRERIYIVGHLREKSRPQVFPISGKISSHTETSRNDKQEPERIVKTRHLSQNGKLTSSIVNTLQASEIPCLIDNSYPSRSRSYSDVAPTVRDYGSGGNKMPMVNGVRRLTPIECERLQGFPDDYTKYRLDDKNALKDNIGYYTKETIWNLPILKYLKKTVRHDKPLVVVSDAQRYKVMGNAVTTNVVTEVVKKLFEELRAGI